jgi:arylsulfatase
MIKSAETSAGARTVYWQHENHAAIREGDWKLVTVNDRSGDHWELYNLSADRSESEDLAGKNPERVDRLKKNWIKWAHDVNAMPFPETRKRR